MQLKKEKYLIQIEARFSSVSPDRVRKPVHQPKKGLPPKSVVLLRQDRTGCCG